MLNTNYVKKKATHTVPVNWIKEWINWNEKRSIWSILMCYLFLFSFYICVYVGIYLRVCWYMFVCTLVYICVYVAIYLCVCWYIFVCMLVYVCVYIGIYLCVCWYIFVCMLVYICVYVGIYLCICWDHCYCCGTVLHYQ